MHPGPFPGLRRRSHPLTLCIVACQWRFRPRSRHSPGWRPTPARRASRSRSTRAKTLRLARPALWHLRVRGALDRRRKETGQAFSKANCCPAAEQQPLVEGITAQLDTSDYSVRIRTAHAPDFAGKHIIGVGLAEPGRSSNLSRMPLTWANTLPSDCRETCCQTGGQGPSDLCLYHRVVMIPGGIATGGVLDAVVDECPRRHDPWRDRNYRLSARHGRIRARSS